MATSGALDRARSLNASLSVSRLRRVLLLFRSWINAGGFDVSFAITKHELACVLELPDEHDPRVTFLFESFLIEPAPGQQRVDLITLLTTAALVSHGTLEEKAALVFSLVDLDTEDDIDEDELALVIATCTKGLTRLGIVTRGEKVFEDDAVAIAFEAFEFVGVEDGDKMNFPSFMKWLAFHPRPQVLFDRLSCIFSMCDLAKQMRNALEDYNYMAERDPLAYYEWMHHNNKEGKSEQIHVLTGPIVGKVTSSMVRILLELDASTIVQCFAIPWPHHRSKQNVVQVCELQFNVHEPLVLQVDSLLPGTTYIFRFLGFCRADRDKCVASVTTLPLSPNDGKYEHTQQELLFVNHLGGADGGKNLEVGHRLQHKIRALRTPVITVHYGLRVPQSQISAILKRLDFNQDSLGDISGIVKACCQSLLLRASARPSFRFSANVFLDSATDLLSPSESSSSRSMKMLHEVMHQAWKPYSVQLWGNCWNDSLTQVIPFGRVLIAASNIPEESSRESILALQAAIKANPIAEHIVIITKQPLVSSEMDFKQAAEGMDSDTIVEKQVLLGEEAGWVFLELVAEVSESMMTKKVSLVAFTKGSGYQSSISVKNTKLIISQLVCGSWNHTLDIRRSDLKNQEGLKLTHGRLVIQHSSAEHRPHVGRILWFHDAGKSSGGQQLYSLSSRIELVPLSATFQPKMTLGPVVGFVTPSTAKILVEISEDIVLSCVLSGRLMGDINIVESRVRANQPAIFVFRELRPGSLYDISFPGLSCSIDGAVVQTPFVSTPAFRLLVLSDDTSLDGSILDWTTAVDTTLFLRNVSRNVLNPAIDLQADLALHLGSICSMTHGFLSLLSEWNGATMTPSLKHKVEESLRECIRRHWQLIEKSEVLSRGSHWFSSVGTLRSLVVRYDVPVCILRLVKEVLAEYEAVGSGTVRDGLLGERIAYRLQANVALLQLDTTESMLSNDSVGFCQFPDKLLTLHQWDALKYWFAMESSSAEGHLVAPVNTIIVLCDLPLTSQRATQQQIINTPRATSWDEYPDEQLKLLEFFFTRLRSNPACSAVMISVGNAPVHATVTEIATGCSFLHIITGSLVNPSSFTAGAKRTETSTQQIANRYLIEFEHDPFGQNDSSISTSGAYSTIDVVPHIRGAQVAAREYSKGLPDASLVVGPVVGKVTSRTARILLEVDRTVETLVCALIDTSSSHRISVETGVQSFTPTVLKLEGLKPGARYRIVFEGLLPNRDNDVVWGFVSTPPLTPLACEWLVVNDSIMTRFAPTEESRNDSIWGQITRKGMRAFTAQASGAVAHTNEDKLGCVDDAFHDRFNPWHYIDDNFTSLPLVAPQFMIHLGGQVDMRSAFTDEELVALLVRLAPLQAASGGLTEKESDSELDRIRAYIRHRMQEVYRIYWGSQPVKEMLAHTSNFMFLDFSTDVSFANTKELRELVAKHSTTTCIALLDEPSLQRGADLLLGVAFELWQLYQNQLWADIADRDLDVSNRLSTSKLGFSITSGLTRMIFLNVTPEAFSYCSQVNDGVKLSSDGSTTSSVSSKPASVNMFSKDTWKVFEDAISAAPTSSTETTNLKKKKPSAETYRVQQLVVVVSADIVEWGGTNSYPDIRDSIIHVLEAIFEWKRQERQHREVTLICRSSSGSSMCYLVTDEKQKENIRLYVVGSISQARELLKPKKSAKRDGVGAGGSKKTGYFSKRFTYRTALTVATNGPIRSVGESDQTVITKLQGSAQDPKASSEQRKEGLSAYKTFASFMFLSDLRRGELNENLHFFPPNLPPKVLLGPVLGRMTTYSVRTPILVDNSSDTATPDDDDKQDRLEQTLQMVALPILLEIDTTARITCVVTDALAFQEFRVTELLHPSTPHVFYIRSLLPERRYVYRFEGASNSETRRGSFHTPPLERLMAPTNFITASSNFPEQLDGAIDSLWTPIRERVAMPWSGIDFIVHIGGQVPLQEAVVECVEWAARELRRKNRRGASARVMHEDIESRLRCKMRKRMQQHYHRAWNLPNLREALANCSNWFLRTKADVAPMFGSRYLRNDSEDVSNWMEKAAAITLEVAKQIVLEYQLVLMREVPVGTSEGLPSRDTLVTVVKEVNQAPTSPLTDNEKSEQILPENQEAGSAKQSQIEAPSSEVSGDEPKEPHSPLHDSIDEDCSSQLIQHGSTAFFVCDMRSVNPDEVVTCNNRLQTPLKRTEGAIIGEQQWLQLENSLKVKKTHAFVLLLELPLIFTSAEHVDKVREERPVSAEGHQPQLEDCLRKLYDISDLSQHWISCRRQLEQLLNLLFRWKLKRRGRDVLVVSGSMRTGIDSLIRDSQTGLSLRSVSVGPITARVEPFALPIAGVACPEFIPKSTGSSPTKSKKPSSEARFTFTSTLLPKRNYLLTQISIRQEEDPAGPIDADSVEDDVKGAGKNCSAFVNAVFVSAQDADALQNPEGLAIAPSAHPVDLYKRLPSWWTRYLPMGKNVFWDDTVSLRAASDDELTALRSFIDGDRALASALEVCYDKYHFAEAARLEELRSAHARQRMDIVASLRLVLVELWRLVPEQKRRCMAFVLDTYVSDLLLGHVRSSDSALSAVLDAGAVEFNAFARLCRSLLWSACLLRLSVSLYEEDQRAEAVERWRRQQQKQSPHQQSESSPAAAADAEASRKEDKMARKRAERLREAEEELSIAREQQRLNALADARGVDDDEFARLSASLAARARALEEVRRQRSAAREARIERKAKRGEHAVGGSLT